MLEVKDLHAYYGKSHILQGVDLRIAPIGGQILSALDSFLSFDREFVEAKCHKNYLSLTSNSASTTSSSPAGFAPAPSDPGAPPGVVLPDS